MVLYFLHSCSKKKRKKTNYLLHSTPKPSGRASTAQVDGLLIGREFNELLVAPSSPVLNFRRSVQLPLTPTRVTYCAGRVRCMVQQQRQARRGKISAGRVVNHRDSALLLLLRSCFSELFPTSSFNALLTDSRDSNASRPGIVVCWSRRWTHYTD